MQARRPNPSPLERHGRVRIVGQGLAGSLLALHLAERGVPFVVQDTGLPGAATPVAPGIVNPLAGRSFKPPEHIEEMLGDLAASMELAEKRLGVRIWHRCPILRMFAEPAQHDRFYKSLEESGGSAFVGGEYAENTFPYLNDVYGSFLTTRGGWADLPLLQRATRDWLARDGLLIEELWRAPETGPVAPPGELVVFCEGWQAAHNPLWSFIRHIPAKGEMLMVRFDEPLPRDRIYSQSCWVQPIGDNRWRVGATYTWKEFDSNPSVEGAMSLQENLSLLTRVHFHVEDQLAGVRPIVEDYQPVIGPHPQQPSCYILNALGSKGVLQAPTAVRDLLDHLATGARIPAAWAVDRFK